jgi:hypothetical protein
MKRILLAGAALLALFLGAHASDDRLPTKFVGDWCLAEHTADHLTFYRLGSRAAFVVVGAEDAEARWRHSQRAGGGSEAFLILPTKQAKIDGL